MAVQLVGVVVLARLLSPEDFGLIAMVAVFLTLADLLRDFGLSSAALQAKDLDQQSASNIFWASWGLGALAGIVLVAATPVLVVLYGEPRLGQIVPALAVALFFAGAQSQLQVQLARNLRFVTLAASQVVAPAVGLGLAVLAALGGWGYWALVIQAVSTAIILCVFQALGARWLPSAPRNIRATSSLFADGARMGAAHLLTWAASNVDSLLIGARFGATSLGYYNRAFQLTGTVIGGLLSPMTQVAIPVLNEAQKGGRRPGEMLVRLQLIVAAPVSILMTILALTAPALIPLVLGDEWAPAIVFVQILALAECIHALSFVSYWGFLAARLSKQLLYYNLVTKPLSVVAVVVGSFWGAEGVAWGYTIGLALSWPINLAWLARTAGFDGPRFLFNGLRILAVAGVSFVISFLVFGEMLRQPSWFGVFAASIVTAVVFIALLAVLPGGRRDMTTLIKVIRSLR